MATNSRCGPSAFLPFAHHAAPRSCSQLSSERRALEEAPGAAGAALPAMQRLHPELPGWEPQEAGLGASARREASCVAPVHVVAAVSQAFQVLHADCLVFCDSVTSPVGLRCPQSSGFLRLETGASPWAFPQSARGSR